MLFFLHKKFDSFSLELIDIYRLDKMINNKLFAII